MTWIIAVVVVAVILLAGGGYWYINQNKNVALSNQATSSPAPLNNQTMDADGDKDGDQAPTASSGMMQASPAESSASSASATMEGNAQTITVEGGNFYFKPNQITVKKGVPVKITFNNAQGFHDFTIDDFNVKTKQIAAGNSATVEFTPAKAGSYEFYCSVGKHKEMGMKGTLVVE